MDDAQMRSHIQEHADAVVRGDMDAVIADFAEEHQTARRTFEPCLRTIDGRLSRPGRGYSRSSGQMSTCHSEISDRSIPAFSGMSLDRAAVLRSDPAWIAARLGMATTQVLAAGREGVLVSSAAAGLTRRPILSDTMPEADQAQPILLGLENGAALFAVDLDDLPAGERVRVTDGARLVSLRDAGSVLSHAEGGLAAYLTALLNWHRTHRFCANCGAPTAIAEAGYSRRCPSCGVVHFPRTDPVVIMLVENAGRLLLGRRAGWPHSRYSLLAGFVSPGESLEEAVAREVREESGIEAHHPRFVRSQPWPFPASLMVGFEARSDGGEPRAHDGELEDVRWFTLDAVRAAGAEPGTDLQLPPPISIARFLIDGWLARKRSDC